MGADPVMQILAYPRLTAGRRHLALQRAREALREWPECEARLAPLIDRALEANTVAMDRWRAWEERGGRNLHAAPAVRLDRQLDRAVGGIVRSLRALVRTFPDRSEAGQQAREVLRTVFPGGARAITNLRFVEQADEVKGVLRRLQGEHAAAVEHLGLGLVVRNLAELHGQYVEVLSRPRLTYDEVKAADQRSYDAWLRVVAGVLGLAASGERADISAAAAVLQPLEEQREDYARHRKRRGSGRARSARDETAD